MPGKPVSGLRVLLGDRLVGRLAETPQGLVAFQYDRDWLGSGFSVNPYSLPLSGELYIPGWQPFDGLFGALSIPAPAGSRRLAH